MILAYFLAAILDCSTVFAPVQTIFPEAKTRAVVLGSRSRITTAAKRRGLYSAFLAWRAMSFRFKGQSRFTVETIFLRLDFFIKALDALETWKNIFYLSLFILIKMLQKNQKNLKKNFFVRIATKKAEKNSTRFKNSKKNLEGIHKIFWDHLKNTNFQKNKMERNLLKFGRISPLEKIISSTSSWILNGEICGTIIFITERVKIHFGTSDDLRILFYD